MTSDTSTVAPEDTGEMQRAFLNHKQRAVISLQTNLSNPADFQNTSSLATIALLLMIESLSGDTTTAEAHRSGLSQLAKCSGGTQKPSNFMVSDVLMSDIKSATSSLSQPSMRPCAAWLSDFDRLKHQPFFPHQPDLLSLGSGFIAATVCHDLGPAFVLLLCAMRNLINAVERNIDLRISISDIDGTHFLVLEHQLVSFQSGPNKTGVVSTQLAECCRIGALLYCNLCLWSWPKSATLIENLLLHLRAAISHWTSKLFVFEQLRVLLWLYFMGDFAASSAEEHQWYLIGMKNVLEWLNIETEDHFRSVLASLFYVDRLMGQHLKDCYSKISRRP
jgi:hypothetical protein